MVHKVWSDQLVKEVQIPLVKPFVNKTAKDGPVFL